MTPPTLDPYAALIDGDVDYAALAYAALSDYLEVKSELDSLQRQLDGLRATLECAVERLPNRRLVAYGRVARVVDATETRRINPERLSTLAAWLRETDREEIAEMIEACTEVSLRRGGLRVDREERLC